MLVSQDKLCKIPTAFSPAFESKGNRSQRIALGSNQTEDIDKWRSIIPEGDGMGQIKVRNLHWEPSNLPSSYGPSISEENTRT